MTDNSRYVRFDWAEGRAEGRAEGERHKALELARRMKTKGYPMEDIIEITSLTAETISSL